MKERTGILSTFVVRMEEKIGPLLLAVDPAEKRSLLEKGDVVVKLIMKVSLGLEKPKRALGGPITDEHFDSKLLFFPVFLEDPDAQDTRVKMHGQLNVVFIEVSEENLAKFLEEYSEIELGLIAFFKDIINVNDLIANFGRIKEVITDILNLAGVRKLIHRELLSDESFRNVALIRKDARPIIFRYPENLSNSKLKTAASIVASSMSLSKKLVEQIEHNEIEPEFISYKENVVIVSIAIGTNEILFVHLDRDAVKIRGMEAYLEKMRDIGKQILRLRLTDASLLSRVQNLLPSTIGLGIYSSIGSPLFEESIGIPSKTGEIVSSYTSALSNLLRVESDRLGFESSNELAIVNAQNNFFILGSLPYDRTFLLSIRKDLTINEIILRMKRIIPILT